MRPDILISLLVIIGALLVIGFLYMVRSGRLRSWGGKIAALLVIAALAILVMFLPALGLYPDKEGPPAADAPR